MTAGQRTAEAPARSGATAALPRGKKRDYTKLWGSTKIISRSKKQSAPKIKTRGGHNRHSNKDSEGYQSDAEEEDSQPLLLFNDTPKRLRSNRFEFSGEQVEYSPRDISPNMEGSKK